MKPRLYVAESMLSGSSGQLELNADQSHYVYQVLRLKPNDPIQIFDGIGNRFDTRLLTANKRHCVLDEPRPVDSGFPVQQIQLTLIQGLARGDRMDWVIEKATELGVHAIVPLLADKSAVRLDAGRATKRHAHWKRVTQAACMQCGLDTLPDLAMPATLSEILASHPPAPDTRGNHHLLQLTANSSCSLRTWAERHPLPVDSANNIVMRVTVLVGPESGFSAAEDALLSQRGALAVGLGPRVLRTETAGIVALSLLQGLAGDLR